MCSQIPFDEIKPRLLEMLIQFDKYCKNNGFTYYLSWGSLLGAVRHKGFIPWDDDIDLAMPREDYKRLIEQSKNWDLPYDFFCYEKDNTYPYCIGKLSDRKTLIHSKYMKEYPGLGLFIDIIPMDIVMVSEKQSLKLCREYKHCYKMLGMAGMNRFWPSDNWVKSVLKLFAFSYAKIKGSIYWQERIGRAIEKYSSVDGQSVLQLWYVMPSSWYGIGKNVVFEGFSFPGPCDADSFLSKSYGDYMKLPPKEKQVTWHDYEVFQL